MTANGVLQIAVFFVLICAFAKPMGAFMTKVFAGERTFLHPVLRPVEKLCYTLCGVKENTDQRWTQYAGSLLAFSVFSFLILYLLERLQGVLPFNPMGFSTAHAPTGATPMTPDLAFNTAVSFTTNTNWQNYSGESALSYFVQMAGMTMHNFTSAAVGMAVAVALIRGFVRQQVNAIGNFWADIVRATVYVLLPISIIVALFFCSQGMIQNLHPYTTATGLEGTAQTIAQGPVASQEAIKMLGTNGGGFFGANSAHPFENPTPLTNFVQMLLIFLIPAGLTFTFGQMTGDTRQGWALFAAMSLMFLAGVFVL
jgi:K+-transporting ATPase ATPase A chain